MGRWSTAGGSGCYSARVGTGTFSVPIPEASVKAASAPWASVGTLVYNPLWFRVSERNFTVKGERAVTAQQLQQASPRLEL